MRAKIEMILKNLFRRCGFDVAYFNLRQSPELRRRQIMIDKQIDLVLDVGAAEGQYASEIRKLGYDKRIVSFEPLTRAFLKLAERALLDEMWETHNYAMGSFSKNETIHIAGNSYSSSLLPMEEQHELSASDSKYISTEQVRVIRMDDIFEAIARNAKSIWLKIDTQGYEKEVMKGCERSLEKIMVLEIELSFISLYKGAPLYLEMIDYIQRKGFFLYSIRNGFTDSVSGQVLQMDGIFVRNQCSNK